MLLIFSSFIFFGYYLLFVRFKIDFPHQRIILAGLWSFGQIILTQLFLGITGLLYLPVLVLLNAGITAIVMLFSGVFERSIWFILQQEYRKLAGGIRNTFSTENTFLFLLLGFVLIWFAVAIYFLPPRCYDDVTYHLPPIYEYILHHKIFLMSVGFNMRFAFPENAELLFMWPAIFLHNQQFVGSVQLVVALWGVFVVYGLARLLGILPKLSLFVSLLFLLTPVVLSQMSSCYTDITCNVFILTVLYCTGMFYKTNCLMYFYSTALAAGLLWGMKYNEILFILMVAPFLCVRTLIRPRNWFVFIIILFIAGGYWYLRNLWVLKTPIYPLPFSHYRSDLYFLDPDNSNLVGFLMLIPPKLLLLWKDIGLGSLHGGYGLIFWGIGLPAWLYVWLRSIAQRKMFDFWMYSSLVIGIGQLMFKALKYYIWVPRFSLFVVVFGLLALGQVVMIFSEFVFFRKAIKVLCILFAVLAVVHLSENAPSLRIDGPITDLVAGKFISKQFYSRSKYNKQVWAVIDYLTVNTPKGLSIYVGSKYNPYVTNAYAYGTKLQNRIWNFQQDKSHPPDAFLFVGLINNRRSSKDYCASSITPEEILVNPEYQHINGIQNVLLFIRKNYFQNPHNQQLLNNYYKMIREEEPFPFLNNRFNCYKC